MDFIDPKNLQLLRQYWPIGGAFLMGLVFQGLFNFWVSRGAEKRLHSWMRIKYAALEAEVRRGQLDHSGLIAEIRQNLTEARPQKEERDADGSLQCSTSALEKKHQVVALAKRGLSPEAISQRLRLPRGETELLIGISQFGATDSGRETPVAWR